MKGVIITILILLFIGSITGYLLYRSDTYIFEESRSLVLAGNLEEGRVRCEDVFFDRTTDRCTLRYVGFLIRDMMNQRGGSENLTNTDLKKIEMQLDSLCSEMKTKKGKRQCEEVYTDLSGNKLRIYFKTELNQGNPLAIFLEPRKQEYYLGFYDPKGRKEKLPVWVTCNDPDIQVVILDNQLDLDRMRLERTFVITKFFIRPADFHGVATCTVTVVDGGQRIEKEFMIQK